MNITLTDFLRTGEVPPTDFEAYIFWQYKKGLIGEKEAVIVIANHRRDAALSAQKPLRARKDARTSMKVWIATKEPYHDNSTILHVFHDEQAAIQWAALAAAFSDRNHDYDLTEMESRDTCPDSHALFGDIGT